MDMDTLQFQEYKFTSVIFTIYTMNIYIVYGRRIVQFYFVDKKKALKTCLSLSFSFSFSFTVSFIIIVDLFEFSFQFNFSLLHIIFWIDR